MSTVDPFGPNGVNLTCPICLEEHLSKKFTALDCNFGKERLALIDKILDEQGHAWKEGRQLLWIDDWMRIDPKELRKTSFMTEKYLPLLDPTQDESKRLLTNEGYFNLSGLHGGCKECYDRVIQTDCKCPTCRAEHVQGCSSKYLDRKLQTSTVGLARPAISAPMQPLNAEVRDFFGDIRRMLGCFGRSVIGGGDVSRSEHLQIGTHYLVRYVSMAIDGLIHNILFHGAVKVALLAFERFGFRGLGPWKQLADAAIEWNMSWAQHIIIWKAFASTFNYSFRQFSVNMSYTGLSHHVARVDLLAVLWLGFKTFYNTDFGWKI
ncbi:hypothetical protein [Simkania sp.]|uniref:hypothetical protein n=1 Tax=Simkania sp. TaxID=34094 RepID=UPI003B525454